MKVRLKFLEMIIIVTVIVLSLGAHFWISHEPEGETSSQSPADMFEMGTLKKTKLTIVYDNNPYDSQLKTAWGFGCLVETGDVTILFDTGGDHSTLLYNMAELNIDVNLIQFIVLSHAHGDHTGGLPGILLQNNHVKVYVPVSFSDNFKNGVRGYGCELIEVTVPVTICDGIATTGELGTSIKEQSLLVNTSAGLVVITGCAHPGIVSIVRMAKELTNTEVYLVIGGFHLGGASISQLSSIIQEFKDLGVRNVAPCHCSGDRTRKMFQEQFNSGYIEAGVGKIVEIDPT